MSKEEDRKFLTCSLEAYEKIKKKHDKEDEKASMHQWFSDYLILNLEKDEFLARYAPFIEKIGFQDNKIVLKDTKLGQYTEIYLKNNVLQCSLDETTNCIHTQFALALPECSKLAVKKSK